MIDPKFHLQPQADKNGYYPILMLFSVNGKRIQYYTGLKAPMSSKPVKGKDKPGKFPFKEFHGSPAIKTKLEALRRHAFTVESEFIKNGSPQTAELFKQELDKLYKGRVEASKSQKIVDTIEDKVSEYLLFVKNTKAHNTFRNTQTNLNHFRDFLGKSINKLTLSDVDEHMIESYTSYLKDGRLNNTVVKAVQVFRTFLQYCFKKRYIASLPLVETGTPNDITVIHLTLDEVMKIAYTPMPTLALERVRDFFVFGCFTGMRYGDIAGLKKSNVYRDYIQFFNNKNGDTQNLTVPLTPVSALILEKYQNTPGEYALPSISNQKTNDALKLVGEYAGLNDVVEIASKNGYGKIQKEFYKKFELITCHVSRKSFITIAMTLGMPETTIVSITGHTKGSKAFHKYYKVTDQVKFGQMNKIFSI